jgi:hypothetical protein
LQPALPQPQLKRLYHLAPQQWDQVGITCLNRFCCQLVMTPHVPALLSDNAPQGLWQLRLLHLLHLLNNVGSGLSGACAAAGLTAASLGAVVPAGGVPGLPLPVVLVDEGLLLAMRERLRAMAAAVTTAQKEAQYQVCADKVPVW